MSPCLTASTVTIPTHILILYPPEGGFQTNSERGPLWDLHCGPSRYGLCGLVLLTSYALPAHGAWGRPLSSLLPDFPAHPTSWLWRGIPDAWNSLPLSLCVACFSPRLKPHSSKKLVLIARSDVAPYPMYSIPSSYLVFFRGLTCFVVFSAVPARMEAPKREALCYLAHPVSQSPARAVCPLQELLLGI